MRWLPGSLVPPNTSGGGEYFLNERWVARGLVLVVIGDKWITPSGTRVMTPVNNPGRAVGPRGRTTGFGTTDAGNTTARFTGFRLPNSPNGRRSYFGTCRVRSLGGGNLGRVFQDSSGSGIDARAGQHALWMFSSNGFNTPALQIADSNIVQNTFYVNATTSFQAINGSLWHTFGFSCDFPSSGVPSFSQVRGYVNGVEYIGGGGSISGSLSAGPWAATGVGFTDVVFGNRPSDSARNFDGQLGIFAVFDSQLTAAEHQSLHANPNQLLVSSDRGIWAPAVSTVVIYRPGTDITTTDWTAVPGPGFYTAIDEDVASNTDYIQSPNRATPDDRPFEAGLSGTMPAGTWDVSIRTERLAGIMGVRVELMDGITVTGTAQTNITLTGAQDYVIPVTTTANSTKVRIKVYDGGLP